MNNLKLRHWVKLVPNDRRITGGALELQHALSQNPNAIHLLEQHMDKVDWQQLSINTGAI